jgi:hypothetical protein
MMSVVLNRKLYVATAVRSAAEDFAELAQIAVTTSEKGIEVTFDQIDPDVADVLVDEFLNFALAATIGGRG